MNYLEITWFKEYMSWKHQESSANSFKFSFLYNNAHLYNVPCKSWPPLVRTSILQRVNDQVEFLLQVLGTQISAGQSSPVTQKESVLIGVFLKIKIITT